MKISRRLKRSTKQYIIVAFLCISIIGGAAVFTSVLIIGQVREEYQARLDEAYKDMAANSRDVYIAVEDLFTGDVIEEDNLERRTVYSSQPQITYFTEDQIGDIALVDIPAGTQLLNTMVTENMVSSWLREAEYQVITMNTNISKSDTVDVRICYPNGESFVVLAKKEIKSYTPETSSVYLWLEEEEILRMSAAIVDAGLYTGSKLFVTKYIEPNFQEASAVTYIPSLSILSLIENDPNIIVRCSQKLNKELRKALENRLADSLGMDVSAINWEINPDVSYYYKEETLQDEEASTTESGTVSITPAPTVAPLEENDSDTWDDKELGSESYFYYTEDDTGKGDGEYGE